MNKNIGAYLAFFVLIGFFVALALAKNQVGGTDFATFYKVSERLRAGELIYNSRDSSPFKYAPVTAYLFYPLSYLSFYASKIFFACLNGVVISLLPFLVLSAGFSRCEMVSMAKKLFLPLVIGLMASLRFIDNEVHSAQTNGIALFLILVGCTVVLKIGNRPWFKIAGLSLWLFGALFKFHPLFSFALLLNRANFKRWIWILAVLLGALTLIPNFSLWALWIDHMAGTTPIFEMKGSPLFQGFYPFMVQYFGVEPWNPISFVVFAFFSIPILIFCPTFSLEATSHAANLPRRKGFLLALGGLLIWALTSSPLPWHHTYLPLWAFVPLSFVVGTRGEKLVLTLSAVVLGLSTRGIVGRDWSDFLELHQVVFLGALPMVAVMIWQARHLTNAQTPARVHNNLSG